MSSVDLTIFGKPYTVGCDAGKEQHLRELGVFIDRRLRALSTSAPSVTEPSLMMLLCLMLADELNDATRENFQLRNQLDEAQRAIDLEVDHAVAQLCDDVAARVNAIAGQLDKA